MMNPTPGEDPFAAEVRSSVEEKLQKLHEDYTNPSVCIYRVPDGLRKVNPPCYTPRLVAIGPLHRDKSHLKPMENTKLRFLKEFLKVMNVNIDCIIDFIRPFCHCLLWWEKLAEPKDLCEMMLLDSIFIIQIFRKKESKDPIFDNYWWLRDLTHDFLLVENQIPLCIPYLIYDKYCGKSGWKHNHWEFFNLVNSFFKDVMMTSSTTPGFSGPNKLRHFIAYLRWTYFLNPPSQPVSAQLESTPPLLPLTQKKTNKEQNWKSGVATASKLLECGVKFMVGTSTSTSLMEIKFKHGILTIPQIKVNDWTETLFRNLIAYEHCEHLTPRYVTNYIIFMDSLIDTPKDVNILIDNGIIRDDLQDSEKVSKLFNNLYKEVITKDRELCFAQLSCDLNDYRRSWWHQWKARWYNWKLKDWYKWEHILKRDYFNSPWSTISIIAAVILLGLTLVQTVCSIYQAKGIKM